MLATASASTAGRLNVQVFRLRGEPQFRHGLHQFGEAPAPAVANLTQIGVALAEANAVPHGERILGIAQDVNGRADGDVAFHGRIHGQRGEFHRLAQRGLVGKAAIQDRLAVFELADLQERRVLAGVHDVALGIDAINLVRQRRDLPAHQTIDVELVLIFFEMGALRRFDFANFGADVARRFKHRALVHQVRIIGRHFGRQHILLDEGDHGMREREVARSHQTDHTFAGHLVHVHLAVRIDVVHAGVAARIGHKNDSLLAEETETVGHGKKRSKVEIAADAADKDRQRD
jgi:hypothetical protein